MEHRFVMVLVGVAFVAQAHANPALCRLFFENIATRPDPAQSCRFEGCFTTPDKKFEDLAKNSFCLNASKPTDLGDFRAFRTLQARNESEKTGNRSRLRAIKPLAEGSIVRLVAYMKEAHTSDCPGGESVNCDKTGFVNNDIHIPLVEKPGDDECLSVTAEMSPHFRPAAWSQIDQKTPVSRLVRITGPLFFDSSHKACTVTADNKITARESPARLSLWEIHPVYAIEVCTTDAGNDCKVEDGSHWLAYDQWVVRPGVVVTDTGKKQREECSQAPIVQKDCKGTVLQAAGGVRPKKHK